MRNIKCLKLKVKLITHAQKPHTNTQTHNNLIVPGEIPQSMNECEITMSDINNDVINELIAYNENNNNYNNIKQPPIMLKSIFSEMITHPLTQTKWELELTIDPTNNDRWMSIYLNLKNKGTVRLDSIAVSVLFTINDTMLNNKHSIGNIYALYENDIVKNGFSYFIPTHIVTQLQNPTVKCWFAIQNINKQSLIAQLPRLLKS